MKVTAKDLATWIQKEVDKTAVTNPDGSDGMSDGELLDYIYDTCRKITEGGQALPFFFRGGEQQ